MYHQINSLNIQFVSEIFVLEDTLHISNGEDIHLEGTAKSETRMECKKQSQEGIGLEFMKVQNLTTIHIMVEGWFQMNKVCVKT